MLLSIGITLLALVIPPVAAALRLHHLPLYDWGIVVLFSLGALLIIQLLRRFRLIPLT